MKLKAFRIKNYRSVKDTGWNHLAYDNITALIGQNESGKTSVLEALLSFYNGRITDDILRSDMTWPEVSCIFDLNGKNLFDIISRENIPQGLIEILTEKKEVTLTRGWKPDRSSVVQISDDDVSGFYLGMTRAKAEFDLKVREDIQILLKQADIIFREMQSAENDKNEAGKQLNDHLHEFEIIKKKFNKARKEEERFILERELEAKQEIIKHKDEELKNRIMVYEAKKGQTQEISEKVSVSKKYNEMTLALKTAEKELIDLNFALGEAQQLFEICSNDREKRIASQRLEQAKMNYHNARRDYHHLTENLLIQKHLVSRIFSGVGLRQAETEVYAEIENEKKMVFADTIGTRFFAAIPVFDFFEDFSSLLPNKIDLEDILLENINAEGYKAAKNFLIVAGLKPEFFREKNHRILKQKIENLNGEITINFQDYWRQNVGKNNKIKLNFELEHYDYTIPEKSGKPYLEFWIKDKQERLYPKQRSRGVRWFLSFFLELKATALEQNQKRVLLIDEPGLSLHARAQEDVLKVFDDLKDMLQIIYCTHSPHLIDANRLYRIIAVQRADHDDENSESVLIDAKSLHSASADTLSPIYSLMGAKLNEQQFISQKNNIVLQDPVTYYYLNSVSSLMGSKQNLSFIPASGEQGIHAISNLLTGWGIDFSMLFFCDDESEKVSKKIKQELFPGNEEKAGKKIRIMDKYPGVEDLFSTIDFKRFILGKRVGITESNLEYIRNNNLSRMLLAAAFINHIQNNSVSFSDFDEETQQNFRNIFKEIHEMI